MKNVFLVLLVLLGMNTISAQGDTIIALKEVVLSDVKLNQFSDGIKIETLGDSILLRNLGTLTDNLRENTHIYFKENGYGMVSSASFRGTNAQQTAVVWNGININSQLTGQTDFNTLVANNLDGVTVRSGGGSTQYGTGAIGGTVHLNQTLNFNEHFKNSLMTGYGSFDTYPIFYNTSYGNEKTSFKIGLGHRASENDYKYLGTDRKNENGTFSNYNFDMAFGRLLSRSNLIKIYHTTFFGNRDFSGTLTAPSDDTYSDINSRSLAEWTNFNKNRVQRLKMAYLYERYRYYPNKTQDNFSFGKSGTILINYDYKYRWKKWIVNGIAELNAINAEGSSIQKENRTIFSTILLISSKPTERLAYGLNFRKDWVSDYNSPFVFSFNGNYKLTKVYKININTSKNFRIPTFNDLYWETGGNPDLRPETSYQGEFGQSLTFDNLRFGLTGYYISSKDLIQWRPNTAGVWSPINVQEVSQYGIEFETNIERAVSDHRLMWSTKYAFTKSVDDNTGNQLLYVPLHRLTSNLSYSYRKWAPFIQVLYNGTVFTTTDNAQNLPSYVVGTVGLQYSIPKIYGIAVEALVKVNNILNENYQNVAFRPMPNRNIHLQLNFKF